MGGQVVHPSASVASSPSELPTQTQKERQVEGWLPEERTVSLVPHTQQGVFSREGWGGEGGASKGHLPATAQS